MMYMYLKNFKKKKYRFVHVTFMYYMYTHVYIPACELSLYQKVQRSLYYFLNFVLVKIYIFFFNIQDFLEDWAPQGFYIYR